MKLPETTKEWESIKKLFLKKKGIEDTPETWTFVISQLQGTKMPELEFDLEDIWKHYKRWKIAKVLQDEKMVYIAQLEAKLKSQIEAMNEGISSHADMREGSLDPERELSTMSATQEGMVQSS